MLNRRYLRIKTMQTLYSYFQQNKPDIAFYEKELFKTFSTRYMSIERYGGNPNPINHYEIPIKNLIDLARHQMKVNTLYKYLIVLYDYKDI